MHGDAAKSALKTKGSFGRIARVAAGNLLEMYDFMVFGYYAASISRAFFPSQNAFSGLMLTFMTFGAGFLMRPLGAILLGAYTDRHGRRAGLILTLELMAVGTFLLACVPNYSVIGIAAPLLVLFGRLVQGFSAGVELGAVSVYLSEIAPAGKKGFFVSWQSASQQIAVMFAASLGVYLSSALPAASMVSWGWRIPLLVGCAIVPLLFLLRLSLEETEAFQARTKRHSAAEIFASLARNWRIVTAGMMMVTLTTVLFYLITAYTPTFGSAVLHLSSRDSLVVTLLVGASNFILLPMAGALSDRIGRRPLLITFTVLAMLTAYPAMLWLVEQPSFERLLAVELWLSLLFSGYNGAMVVYLTEVVPPHLRTAGFSMAYSLATAVFGGFTPAICTWLLYVTGNRAVPGVWVSAAALIGLAGVLLVGWLTSRDKEGFA